MGDDVPHEEMHQVDPDAVAVHAVAVQHGMSAMVQLPSHS